jgi:uncharacterized protein YlbG (UPF0298 family)
MNKPKYNDNQTVIWNGKTITGIQYLESQKATIYDSRYSHTHNKWQYRLNEHGEMYYDATKGNYMYVWINEEDLSINKKVSHENYYQDKR